MKTTLIILFLIIPLLWELWNDRNGDPNKKRDVFIRGMLIAWSGVMINLLTGVPAVVCIILGVGTFFLLFDYLVVVVLKYNKIISETAHWFTYLGKKGYVDNLKWWGRLGPWWRLIVKLSVFLLSLILFLIA